VPSGSHSRGGGQGDYAFRRRSTSGIMPECWMSHRHRIRRCQDFHAARRPRTSGRIRPNPRREHEGGPRPTSSGSPFRGSHG